MEAAEQRWRAGEFIPYSPRESPPESLCDENEATLTPSRECTFEDTLTVDPRGEAGGEAAEEDLAQPDNDSESARLPDGINDLPIDESVDDYEVFEDCLEHSEPKFGGADDGAAQEFERTEETLTLEMKIALGNE